jgi:hypothetical protein
MTGPGCARTLRAANRGTIRSVTPTASTPTHGCARCGRPVPPGVGLCEECNPLGLRDAAASQVHGTVVIAVLVGVILLALVARLSIAGGGPYPATIGAIEPAGTGLAVAVTVTNEGSATGQTTCRLDDPGQLAGGTAAFVLSPRIEPGQTLTFTSTVTEFGATPLALRVECRTP